MSDLDRLLDALSAAAVQFVVVGGVAMVLRGSSRVTLDLDVCMHAIAKTCAAWPLLWRRAQVETQASPMAVGAARVAVLGLDGLERAKRAAGRAKDLLDLAEIVEIRRRSKEP